MSLRDAARRLSSESTSSGNAFDDTDLTDVLAHYNIIDAPATKADGKPLTLVREADNTNGTYDSGSRYVFVRAYRPCWFPV